MSKTGIELQAESEICDVQRRYCRGVDRLDWDMVRACFHDDADADYGHYKGGPDGFVAMARAGLPTYSSTTHFIGNQLVEVDAEGDGAWAEHYVVAWHRCPQDGEVSEHDFVCNFRYVDRMERRGGEWRISKRVLLVDSWRRLPLPDFGPGPTIKQGTRDKSDPSWSNEFRRNGR